MKISTKGRYALRVMADIALNYKDKNISITELSSRNNISDKYLEQIISLLVKKELLQSFRGSQGGYKLSRPANKISVGEIINATEGEFESVSCISGNEKCDMSGKCLTVNFWAKLDRVINEFLNSTTLDDVVNKRL